MLYISKGTVMPNSTEQLLFITHCGKVFTLTELECTHPLYLLPCGELHPHPAALAGIRGPDLA